MSQDLIKALERVKETLEKANTSGVITDTIWHGLGETLWDFIDNTIDRHRFSVESVDMPDGDAWRTPEQYSPDVGSWHDYYDNYRATNCTDGLEPLYTASTVRSLIAAAVEREREECAKACESIEDEYQRTEGRRYPELKSDAQTGAADCAAAIRARGEMK